MNAIDNIKTAKTAQNKASVVDALVIPQNGAGKYTVVYADPPWRYDHCRSKAREIENHYPTMEIEDIVNMPIKRIAKNDSVLFIWGTFPKLRECFEVIDGWGFNYRTVAFVWIKTNKKTNVMQTSFLPQDNFDSFWGMGNWTRSNAEICLLATRGNPKRMRADIHQVIYSPIQKHSQKPHEARKRIELLMGGVEKIELFARERRRGWDVFGNEIKSDIDIGGFAV